MAGTILGAQTEEDGEAMTAMDVIGWTCMECHHRWEPKPTDCTAQHCDQYEQGNHPPLCPDCGAVHRTAGIVEDSSPAEKAAIQRADDAFLQRIIDGLQSGLNKRMGDA